MVEVDLAAEFPNRETRRVQGACRLIVEKLEKLKIRNKTQQILRELAYFQALF